MFKNLIIVSPSAACHYLWKENTRKMSRRKKLYSTPAYWWADEAATIRRPLERQTVSSKEREGAPIQQQGVVHEPVYSFIVINLYFNKSKMLITLFFIKTRHSFHHREPALKKTIKEPERKFQKNIIIIKLWQQFFFLN